MSPARIFLALGSNATDAEARLHAALAALDRGPVRVVSAARYVSGPYVTETGEPDLVAAPVCNTVVEVRSSLDPEALLVRLQEIETEAGRVRAGDMRAGAANRTLDLDLLAYADLCCESASLTLPHPRFAARAFVLGPWEEIAPDFLVSVAGVGTAPVVAHAATLRRDHPERFAALCPAAAPRFADRAAACVVLETRAELDAWRRAQPGVVGLVPTMGALHAGHASLVQRAAAECDAVVVTLFVNPLQFAPGEDLARYPRTLQADCELLARHGADAVYTPAPEDLFPTDFATLIEPGGAAEGLEGAARPGHFRGVATVVVKLWTRTRPDRGYFGRKDAQQLAVLRQVVRDLDLPGEVVACPTVRAPDGLARSSRNRYLSEEQRELATTLSAALADLAERAAVGEVDCGSLGRLAIEWLERAGLGVDYLALVDPNSMQPLTTLREAALAVAAVRLGEVRLLDNRWVAAGLGVGVPRAVGER